MPAQGTLCRHDHRSSHHQRRVAQLSTAQLNGRVTDESGALLPGVTVTATQTDTGVTRTDVTDGNGSYDAAQPSDRSASGSKSRSSDSRTYVQTGIVLQVAGIAGHQRGPLGPARSRKP